MTSYIFVKLSLHLTFLLEYKDLYQIAADSLVDGFHQLYHERVDGVLSVVVEGEGVVKHDVCLKLIVVRVFYLRTARRLEQLADMTTSSLILIQPATTDGMIHLSC